MSNKIVEEIEFNRDFGGYFITLSGGIKTAAQHEPMNDIGWHLVCLNDPCQSQPEDIEIETGLTEEIQDLISAFVRGYARSDDDAIAFVEDQLRAQEME